MNPRKKAKDPPAHKCAQRMKKAYAFPSKSVPVWLKTPAFQKSTRIQLAHTHAQSLLSWHHHRKKSDSGALNHPTCHCTLAIASPEQARNRLPEIGKGYEGLWGIEGSFYL
jgi:hypothetical protein